MGPSAPGRPPGAPRKPSGQVADQDDGRTTRVSGSTDRSSSSGLGQAGDLSHASLFTMPGLPGRSIGRPAQEPREEVLAGDTGSMQRSRGPGPPPTWLSRQPHEQDRSSSAYMETPTTRQAQGQQYRSVSSSAQAFLYTTPSVVRPSVNRLYQDLTRGIAASRRTRPQPRVSMASSSGWGSPKTTMARNSRQVPVPEPAFMVDIHSAAAGPSRLPRKVPTGVFDAPQTPSYELSGLQIPDGQGSYPEVNGARVPQPLNQDGSFCVVRGEDDANNSGLLGMSPAIRRINGLGLAMTPGHGLGREVPQSSPMPNAKTGVGAVEFIAANGRRSTDTSTQANQSIIEHFSHQGGSGDTGEMQAMRDRLLQTDGWDHYLPDDRSALLEIMRNWREDAMKHHLYDTAIFWGDKILNMETTQIAWNDAYNLATAYFLTHRYAQAEHLLTTPLRLASKGGPAIREEEEGSGEEDEDNPPLPSEDHEWDVVDAALANTRHKSNLPASMLAKMDGADVNGAHKMNSPAKKRKERNFTVSGTGTGSEGTSAGASGETVNGEEGAMDNVEAPSLGEQVTQAWKEEQRIAMEEVRERDIPSPDSVSLVSISVPCKYLAAQCMVRQEKYQEALDELSGWRNESVSELQESYKQPSKDGLIKLSSSIWHLKGLIHLKLRNIDEAKEDFIKSLSLDVKNFESFDQLVRGNLLTSSEQWSLVEGLQYISQAGDDPAQLEALHFVQMLYTTRLDKTGKLHAQQAAAARRHLIHIYGLDNDADVLQGLAEEMFARAKYEDAYAVTKRIMEVSKDHEASLPVYLSTMYMIERLRPTLFLVAHHLTDMDPDMPAAWYAVGCWYLGTKQWLEARKYFSKCVQIDPRFAPGWIAFAHTFSYEGESDQAIVSYSTAERLFTSNHLIKLFVGMEHLNQANLTLAEIFLQGSAALWEEDPLSRNERGVVQYYKGNIEEAIRLFQAALEAAKDVQQPPAAWAATHLNLGFAFRRIKETEQAKKSFLQTIELNPDCSAAHTGIGMCYHRAGHLSEAILWYHRALSISSSDKQSSELLALALQESARSMDLSSLDPLGSESGASMDVLGSPGVRLSRGKEPQRRIDDHTASTVTMEEDSTASLAMDESI